MIKEINNEKEFNELLKKEKIVVIDFSADWCPTCKLFKPIFTKVAKSNDDAIYAIVDVDSNSNLATEWGVQSIPTTVFIKDNKEVERISGFINEDDLISKVKGL